MKGEVTIRLWCQSPIDHPNCQGVIRTFTACSVRDAREQAELAGWRKLVLTSHYLTGDTEATDVDTFSAYACPKCMRLIDRYLRQDIPGNEVKQGD